MANKERGEFVLAAGDTDYTLRLTTNTCCELEDLVGKLWPHILAGGQRGSLRDVRSILWAALRETHPDLAAATPEGLKAVGGIIDACGGIVGAHRQIKQFLALNADSGEATTGGAGRPQLAQAGTGVSSTSTPSHSV